MPQVLHLENTLTLRAMDLDSKINRQLAGQPVAYFLFEFQVTSEGKRYRKDINYLNLFFWFRLLTPGVQCLRLLLSFCVRES